MIGLRRRIMRTMYRQGTLRSSQGAHKASMMPFALLLIIITGCSHVDAPMQRLVSKPNMVFSDSTVFAYQSRFTAIIEPGSASDGGSAATGCSSCR